MRAGHAPRGPRHGQECVCVRLASTERAATCCRVKDQQRGRLGTSPGRSMRLLPPGHGRRCVRAPWPTCAGWPWPSWCRPTCWSCSRCQPCGRTGACSDQAPSALLHERQRQRGIWPVPEGKCVPAPGFSCTILHPYNRITSVSFQIHNIQQISSFIEYYSRIWIINSNRF